MDYETYCIKAMISYNNKEWYRAYSLLQKVLIFDSEDLNWLLHIIKVCIEIKKYKESENYCKVYLSLSDSSEVRRLLSFCYIQTNQLQKALEICPEDMKQEINKELQMDPSSDIMDKFEKLKK